MLLLYIRLPLMPLPANCRKLTALAGLDTCVTIALARGQSPTGLAKRDTRDAEQAKEQRRALLRGEYYLFLNSLSKTC